MKKLKTLLVLLLTAISLGTVAQIQKVNTEKSTIHWLGKKIGGQHDGILILKVDPLN